MFGENTKDVQLMYLAGLEAVKAYQEGVRVTRIAPKVKLLISPFVPPFVPIEFLSTDVGGIIETYTWDKSRNQSHGNFSVVMQADDKAVLGAAGWPLTDLWRAMGESLEDILKPPVLAQLWVQGYHIMTGRLMVRRNPVTKSGSGWKKQYVLQFEEMGSLYKELIHKDFFNFVSEEVLVLNDATKVMTAGATQFGFHPLSVAMGLYVYAFSASTLNYGFKGFPRPFMSGSDALPIAARLVALPAPLGAISNMTLVTQLVTDSTLFAGGGGSFWDFLKTLIPEPFLELYTESGGRVMTTGKLIPVGGGSLPDLSIGASIGAASVTLPVPGLNVTPLLPGFNYIVCRTSPYDNPLLGISMWHPLISPFTMGVFDLLTGGDFVIITDDDLISKDLGVSGKQQFTAFHCAMSGKNATGGSGSGDVNRPSFSGGPFLPVFPGGLRSYGFKLMDKNIDGTSLAWGALIGQSIQRFTRKFKPGVNIKSLSSVMNYWFRNVSKFKEGTIVTKEIPYAKPGMALLYLPTLSGRVDNKRDVGIYYIDNVSNSNTIGKGGTTQFSVIRGTPIPYTVENLLMLLLDWEIAPAGLNLYDAEYP